MFAKGDRRMLSLQVKIGVGQSPWDRNILKIKLIEYINKFKHLAEFDGIRDRQLSKHIHENY